MKRNTYSFLQRKHGRGLTFIELLIAIIVILTVAALAVAGGMKLLGKSDSSADFQATAQLLTNTKSMRGSSGYGPAGTSLVPALIQMDAVPAGITVTGNKLYNKYGGEITVVSTGLGTTTTSNQVPKESCIESASKLAGGRMVTKINGGTAVTGEMLPTVAATSCTTDSNTIVWTTPN